MSPRFIAVISVTHNNYHKLFLSSSRRWTHRRLLEDNHLLFHAFCGTPTAASEALEQIDERRRMVVLDPQCSRGMHGVHPGTLRLVARPLPVRGCHFHRIRSAPIVGGGGRVRMAAAGRRNHFKTLCAAPSTLSWDHIAKRSTGSEQLTSWFAGSQAQPIASEEWRVRALTSPGVGHSTVERCLASSGHDRPVPPTCGLF